MDTRWIVYTKNPICVAIVLTILVLASREVRASDLTGALMMEIITQNTQTAAEYSARPGHGKPNRLISEKSPYLLQHAYNPVEWFPWGEEAFTKARQEDKPIFLSIGYSTCHWCHVMEKESFEDEETARLINDTFVSIKVDREERPDIDHIYMVVCQMMTGGGGWPLNVIMTADRKPFFAGTYFPKETRPGRIGMIDLSHRIKELWTNKREDVLQSAGKVMAALRQVPDESPGEVLGTDVLDAAYRQLAQRFDVRHGGFSQAPKFPTPHNMLFLLRYWKRTGDRRALEMVEQTLDSMRLGGIYDQVGFGFHRYSTDDRWLVPHFEKMLYDQAMLAMTYTEAYQATGKPSYAKTAQEIFTYVLRDMTSEQGGFFSAEDADSEGEEGKFYVWKLEEIQRALDDRQRDLAIAAFGLQQAGNFKEEATGRLTGNNILYLRRPAEKLAADFNLSDAGLESLLEQTRQELFESREKRIHPHKDDKILTDWNGLMIAALSQGYQVFHKPEYLDAAKRAADFILGTLRTSDGLTLHRYRDGEAGMPAHVDDYAFLVWGLLDLYEAGFEVRYLKSAQNLTQELLDRFWDASAGGFFFTADDGEQLILRKKEIYDGATPSGNSVAMLNLLRLARITGDPELEHRAHLIGRTFSGNVRQFPSGYTQLLAALEFAQGPSHEVVIVGQSAGADTERMLRQLNRPFLPNKVVLLRPADEASPEIADIAKYTKDQHSIDGQATAYVCVNYSCELPTTDTRRMLQLLGEN